MSAAGDHRLAPAIAGLQQLTDYDEIREVLRSPHFVQGAYEVTGGFHHDTMPRLDGPRHVQRRRVVGKLFTDAAMARYRKNHLHPTIAACLAEVADDRDADGTVRADLVPLLWKMTHRIAAGMTGIDGLSEPAAAERFIGLVRAIGAAATADWAIGDRAAIVEAGEDARSAYAEEFLRPAMARRRELIASVERGDRAPAELPTDLVTMLLLHLDDAEDEGIVLRESSIFLVAATQTSTHAAMLFVLQLDDWFARHPADRARLQSDPGFLPRAAFESLRLFIAAPARIRRAVEEVTLRTGRVVEAGERVALLFAPANQQADHFGAHADVFDPWREPPEGTRPWGLAFSGGAHTCIGRPLVTGVGSRSRGDGTMVSIAHHLYGAGIERDPSAAATSDDQTYYRTYTSVPVRFTGL